MTDPVLMITGASRGIGAATARRAAANGYRLTLVSRSTEGLQPLVDELGSDKALAFAADVTEWEQVQQAVAATEEHYGRIDAAFANAGQMIPTSFFGNGGAEPERWREMILANVYGPAITARAVLPALARTEGHLVLTGSVAGRGIRPANLYSATKWAVTALAGSIRAEAVGTGVRVTVVQPGLVDTELIFEEQRSKPNLVPDDIARSVCFALEQPKTVDVNEIVVRPTGQDPER